jgi:hypothetical protein
MQGTTLAPRYALWSHLSGRQTTDAAAKLMKGLHPSSLRLFLGRRLRCEVARAYRTFLVSYR